MHGLRRDVPEAPAAATEAEEGQVNEDSQGAVPLYRANRALRTLVWASGEALKYFEAEDYDSAWAEVIRCRRALDILAAFRPEEPSAQEAER